MVSSEWPARAHSACIQHQGVRGGYCGRMGGGQCRSKKGRGVGSKIIALVGETKEWLGKCKIGMSDKSETARGKVRKGFGYAAKTGHLFLAISRAALISGASVRNGSAIAKNACCKSCVASGRLSASTSSVFAR